jgi:hypothetical protein
MPRKDFGIYEIAEATIPVKALLALKHRGLTKKWRNDTESKDVTPTEALLGFEVSLVV